MFRGWKFWRKQGEEEHFGNEGKYVANMKSKISKKIQYLRTCTDYTAKEALEAFYTILAIMEVLEKDDVQKVIREQRYAELFVTMWASLAGFLAKQHDDCHNTLNCMITTYRNLTDLNSELSAELGKTDCIPILIGVLDDCQHDLASDDDILEGIVAVLQNVIQNYPDNARVFRGVNALPILKRYLHQKNQAVQIEALIILAYIADETEVSLLQTVDGAVVRLVSMIKEAIHDEDHRASDGASGMLSVLELLQGLNKLAVNDANKIEIANNGGIPVFVHLLQDDFSTDEQIAAVKALWNLAFIEDLRKSAELQEAIKLLERLILSSSQELQHVCTYAMWEIKGRIPQPNKSISAAQQGSPPSYEESITQSKAPTVVKPQKLHVAPSRIMISYQWDDQEKILKIRDRLTETGYQVWMDVTHMRGSILTAMAEAVEQSSIILVCMSEKYKNSENCRAEAAYAFDLKKTIIPLRMNELYTPDGWLGIIVSGKLYHKFYSIAQIESSINGLVKDIDGAHDTYDEVDGDAIKPIEQEVLNSSASPRQKVSDQERTSTNQWSREDVQVWLKDNELAELCETFKRCRGSHIEEMFSSCCEDKKAFNDELKSDYGVDNAQVRMEFVVALKEAFHKK